QRARREGQRQAQGRRHGQGQGAGSRQAGPHPAVDQGRGRRRGRDGRVSRARIAALKKRASACFFFVHGSALNALKRPADRTPAAPAGHAASPEDGLSTRDEPPLLLGGSQDALSQRFWLGPERVHGILLPGPYSPAEMAAEPVDPPAAAIDNFSGQTHSSIGIPTAITTIWMGRPSRT